MLRADWFVAVAARPPLYNVLLQLPIDAATLEAQLKVDVPDDFRRNRLDRAGFLKSGVSEQNRLIERHDAAYGAYWRSYDFKKAGEDRADLIKSPLGPRFPGNPFPDSVAFAPDGGEIIFNLPNGLQGYLLVNGKGERIDQGPIEVVSDVNKTSGSNVIVNGLSCMACHQRGMVRRARSGPTRNSRGRRGPTQGGAALPGTDQDEALVKEDEDRFLQAVEKAVGPFLRVGHDRDRPVAELPEPVGETAR